MKILSPSARFNITAIILSIFVMALYFNYGRAFLSWRNFTIFIVSGVTIFLIISRSKSGLLKATFILALVPVIPDPLAGIPVCCVFLVLCFAIYGIIPGRHESIRLGLLPIFNLAILSASIVIAGIVNWKPGNIVFLSAWLYGILVIYMSIRTFPNVTSSSNLVNCYWIGSSITCTLGFALSIFPNVKLPGISVSVNYAYQIGALTYGRYSGVLGDYELYGQFCGLASLVSLYIGLTANNYRRRLSGYLTFLISVQQLLLTGTRSSLFLTIIFIFLLLARAFKSRLRNSFGLPLFLVSILISASFLKSAIDQSGSIFRIDKSLNDIPSAFDSDRGDLWQYFLNLMPQELLKIPKNLQFPVSEFGTLPHSLPFALIFMFGIIPFVCFLIVILVPLIVLSWRGSFQDYLLKLMLSQLLLESLKVEAIRLPQYLTVFFTLVGLCYVSAVETERNRKFNLSAGDQ